MSCLPSPDTEARILHWTKSFGFYIGKEGKRKKNRLKKKFKETEVNSSQRKL